MNIRHIERYLGIFLLISGILSLLPAVVAYLYGEPIVPHLVVTFLSCFCAMFFIRSPPQELRFGDAMLLTAVALLFVSLFGAIPFFMTLEGSLVDNIVNGYFESVSGYTTTGLTILGDELDPASDSYMHSTIFRRALSEWVGGLGIIVLFLSILARGGISTVYLYKMGVGIARITPSVERTAKIILRVYLFYTFIGIVLLWLITDDLFYSATGIMSTIATGGFIFMDVGFRAGFGADFATMSVLAFSMLVGAVPFTMHYVLFSGSYKKFFRNVEIKTLFWMIAMSFLFFVILLRDDILISGIPFLQQLFLAVISTITTTGGTDFDLDRTGDVGKLILISLTVVGAGAGSTCGGLKLIRFAVLMKAIKWLITKSSLPDSAVVPLKLGRQVFSNKELRIISLYFFIYIILIFSGMLVLLMFGVDPGGESVKPIDALLLSASAQGTSSVVSLDIAPQPVVVKIFLIFLMIAGRLEIFPILALLGYIIHGAKTEAIILEHEAVEVEHGVFNGIEKDIEIVEQRIERYIRRDRGAGKGK